MNVSSLTPIPCALALASLIYAAGAIAAPKRPDKQDSSSSTFTPEMNSGRDALRHIVQDQCLVNWESKQDPAPCERVFMADAKSDNSGYAVLADRKGGAHFLLIPTQTMVGTDSSELLDPDAQNYFAEAWHARDLITTFVGHAVPRTAIGLAINTAHSRTQNQFHVHIECLRQDVAADLRGAAEKLTTSWAPIQVGGSSFQAQRVMGDSLDGANPFELLAKLGPDVSHHMGDYTLLIAGMQFRDGPGFAVLTGTGPTGELLLDSTCSLAGAGG